MYENMSDDELMEHFKAFSKQQPEPTSLPKSKWLARRKRSLRRFSDPTTIQIVCSHKSGTLSNKRPATLGEAIIEMDTSRASHIALDWNPVRGNMNNRMNRKGHYNPVAIDEAVPPPSPEELRRRGIDEDHLEYHDAEGLERLGTKGMSRVRRNAITNYYADQLICPRCTMHVSRNDEVLKQILRGIADAGMTKLDIQYIDFYAKML
ncbi:hypothetical protein [Corynebacterium epidermidicanis]|uniref:Uncharacterized protein n=1 Tax=Corynebacterium epidermidicanis TaxID=1050174 RepID=A0A0G3GTZ9_9CORY|nr:hypothetical protein [Corynebacterium epidermidicanis]AKK02327.1 hypothetical protein CEPID_02230 [Corynebacterium epidermidicanis]